MFNMILSRLCTGLFAGLALFPAAAHADGPPLTLAAAQARVLANSPALQVLSREIGAQQGLVRQAGALPNPELSGLVEDRQRDTRSTTIQLTQAIETGGKRAARVDAAERERDLAGAALQVKQAQLRAATSSAFYTLLAAQERQKLADSQLALAKEAESAASARVAAGKNSPVDATRAGLATSSARIELLQVRSDLEQAKETLAALWGGSAKDLPSLEGQLERLPESPPLHALLERLQQSPALLHAQAELQRRQALGRVERARRMPDLNVTVGSKKDEQLGRRQAVFGLSLPLPLFDRNQGRLQEALQRTEQARDEATATAAALASELRIAHGRLNAAREQADTLRQEHLPGARSTYEAARKGYEYGKFSILDVFDAQRVLLQAQGQYLRLLADAHGAAADIERILGAPRAISPQDLP